MKNIFFGARPPRPCRPPIMATSTIYSVATSPSAVTDSSSKISPWNLFPDTSALQPPNSPVVDGVVSATVPEVVLENSQPLWNNYIIGHFIGDAPHIGKVHATVNRLWTSADKTSKVDAQFITAKSVLFHIDHDLTRSRVLRRHFWHIADIPMVVQDWSPRTANARPDLTAIPIWVDFKGVLDHLFTHKGLKFLGDIVGVHQKLHPNTERCLRFYVARVLCIVNLEKPLPEVIRL